MARITKWFGFLLLVFALLGLSALLGGLPGRETTATVPDPVTSLQDSEYIILAWNDLGMHRYNPDFADLATSPPFNTLWAQVLRVADPPEVVTSGITVTYHFADNTYSVGKTNFWDHEDALFGVNLPPNVGLAGKGLAGEMDLDGDHFIAEGIPLTEYRDSNLVDPYPYQLATITVYDSVSGAELASLPVVAPVSSEISCDNCHYDYGIPGIATGKVETNILLLHDRRHENDYPPGHDIPLMDRRPILCAECHASYPLGAPGLPGIPNLSKAMHNAHNGEVSNDLAGCYNCHPGPETQFLRDTMYQQGIECIECHGGMDDVANNPDPWLNEPRCDNTACHGSAYAQDQALYRLSSEHGGVYCTACHDSPHAIAPSLEPNDGLKFIALQGHTGTLSNCTTCHATPPTGEGPHGIIIPGDLNPVLYLPVIIRR